MRDNNMTITLLVVLLLIAAFMMGAVVAAASPAVEATNDLDEVSELEIDDAVYSDGDEIPSSPSPSSFGTSSSPPPLGSSSSPFVEPSSSSTNNNRTNTGIDANNTTITNTTSIPSSTTTTAPPTTTKTNGLLTATINGTHFTTNQTILVNGTVGEAAGSVIGLFVELKDPHNDMMAFDFAPIVRSDRPGADNETSFSYRLVAGDDGSSQDDGAGDSGGHNRRFWKPMNETGSNYTMTIGYATPALPSSPGSVAAVGGGGEYSRSEVQFVFAYEHLLPPEEEGAAVATTTPAEEPKSEPVARST
jgi:hypothetical protein